MQGRIILAMLNLLLIFASGCQSFSCLPTDPVIPSGCWRPKIAQWPTRLLKVITLSMMTAAFGLRHRGQLTKVLTMTLLKE